MEYEYHDTDVEEVRVLDPAHYGDMVEVAVAFYAETNWVEFSRKDLEHMISLMERTT